MWDNVLTDLAVLSTIIVVVIIIIFVFVICCSYMNFWDKVRGFIAAVVFICFIFGIIILLIAYSINLYADTMYDRMIALTLAFLVLVFYMGMYCS